MTVNLFFQEIEINPPPLVCNSCFVNVWLFHGFRNSAIEVEKVLKGDIPLEVYSKMVLCRTCPVIFGTKFFELEEDSSKGQLLKRIFRENVDGNVSTFCIYIYIHIKFCYI